MIKKKNFSNRRKRPKSLLVIPANPILEPLKSISQLGNI